MTTAPVHSIRNNRIPSSSCLSPASHVQFLNRGKSRKLPPICLMGFYPNLYHEILRSFQPARSLTLVQSVSYAVFQYGKTTLSFVYPGIGAPSAAVCLEQSIAMGVRIAVFFGRAGALDTILQPGDLFVPERFHSQEGVSRHYRSGLSCIRPDNLVQEHILRVLGEESVTVRTGSSCSMDAPYRETCEWIRKMRRKQIMAVDMEASALAAVSEYRSVKLGGFFVISERFNGKEWEFRHTLSRSRHHKPMKMLDRAARAAVSYAMSDCPAAVNAD